MKSKYYLILLFLLVGIIISWYFVYNNRIEHKLVNDEKKEYCIWHYQLQNFSLNNLDYDIKYLVIDPYESKLSKKDIKYLNSKNITVLAYLSIGEAENYRYYWKNWDMGNPNFIVAENPNWEGNYIVKFWDDRWQSIIYNMSLDIIKKGYNGLYLDRIDVYEYFGENYSKYMIDFVCNISNLVKSYNSNTLIITQNAIELYNYKKFRECIDGVGKEDTWFYDDEYINNLNEISLLKRIKDDGKIVLVIDYPTKKENICEFYVKCLSLGFCCTVSNRELYLNKPILC